MTNAQLESATTLNNTITDLQTALTNLDHWEKRHEDGKRSYLTLHTADCNDTINCRFTREDDEADLVTTFVMLVRAKLKKKLEAAQAAFDAL